MANEDPRQWMWGEALDMLARAERLHRQLFQPASTSARRPSWEPPVDVLETDGRGGDHRRPAWRRARPR